MRKLLAFSICCIILSGCSGELLAKRPSTQAVAKAVPIMGKGKKDAFLSRLTFVYGDRPSLVKECKPAWGLVILLEIDGHKILFNAGGDEELMRNNMEALNISPKDIDAAVISHHHWEMVDGIGYVLRNNPGLPVYATDVVVNEMGRGDWSKNFKNVPGFIQLTPNVLLMNLKSPPREGGPWGIQEVHIVVKTKEGLVILQGCGHPRIVNIMRKSVAATGEKRVYMIAGGSRLMRPGTTVKLPNGRSFTIPQRTYYSDDDYRQIADALLAAGVKKIIPTHCTGNEAEAIFKEKFGSNYIHQTLGMKVDIPSPADS